MILGKLTSRPLVAVVVTGLLLFVTLSIFAASQIAPATHAAIRNAVTSQIIKDPKANLAKAAYNETLGFGEIAYISMPARLDRQDAMSLMGSYSGLKFKYIPGVDGNDISPKALPVGVSSTLRPSELGCWRAHVNAWRYLLDQSDAETMLILEDDLDWDVRVHEIFERLSLNMQENPLRIDKASAHEKSSAPYGLDWDFMFLGHCLDSSNPKRLDLVHTYDDPTLPSDISKYTYEIKQTMRSMGIGNSQIVKQRAISPTWGPACTMAYAITRRGAQRLLFQLSYLTLRGPVDNEMAWRSEDGKFHSYTVNPPIFNAFHVGGSKDSDNVNHASASKSNSEGVSLNIDRSIRKALFEMNNIDIWKDYARTHPKTTTTIASTE
ncbi:uncharacterized protein V1516DRAFT_264050 [Lipomyces oligophaga]|uniref:uncharacterized protein n=1 Tax=Lipomyces oligophaga TaxID=45792 RepID=UPI0034CD8816